MNQMSILNHNHSAIPDNIQVTINGQNIHIKPDELIDIKKLGEGSFSVVQLKKDPKSSIEFAVKISQNISDSVMRDIRHDFEIGQSVASRFKIEYYDMISIGPEIWIFMEPMDMSVRTFYKKIQDKVPNFYFPGIVIGYFSYCSVNALEDLHLKKVIHRDVKPSNMLIDEHGKFKLCDFGISGKLKDSFVQSAVGTNAYLAPERINPSSLNEKYSIISDVWSLGLSILEISEMRFPYKDCVTLMNQLNQIVNQDPPKLSKDSVYHKENPDLIEFFDHTLVKNKSERFNYVKLKKLSIIKKFDGTNYFNEARNKLSSLVKEHNK